MPETTEDDMTVEDTLDRLLDAIEALEAHGVDADPVTLREAAAVYDGPIEIADEKIDEGEEKEDAREWLADGRDALLAIADGDGTEEDVGVALERTSHVHETIMLLVLQEALGL